MPSFMCMMTAEHGLPNAVIGGAPKSGTSSLFRWLEAHFQVCASPIKETSFLVDEGHPLIRPTGHYHRDGISAYAQYFSHFDPSRHTVRLEGTTHYLYQTTALEVLSALVPQPHVIFLLRKPSRRILSSYQYSQQTLATLNAKISFKKYIEIINEGGAWFDHDPVMRRYAPIWRNDIRYSQYIEYLRAWKARFSTQKLHVLLFEDLTADPQTVITELARSLELDTTFYSTFSFPQQNETYRVKSIGLQRFARKAATHLPYGALRTALRRQYFRVLSDRTKRAQSAEDTAALQQLDSEFEPFNRALEIEFGLDLRSWR
jgi:hypothetical protein